MKFETVQGNKGPHDLILYIETRGTEQITFAELFRIIKVLYVNDQKIYPRPLKGSKMLLDALRYLRTHTIQETIQRFELTA